MFPCERCAACCRHVGNSDLGKQMALPNGICKYLNQKTIYVPDMTVVR